MVSLAEKLGDWPFLTPIPQLPGLAGEDGETLGIKASDCGECHEEHYADWRLSTHAGALADLQYLAELAKDDSPVWLCLNCHIPVQNQREILIAGNSRMEERGHDLRHLERVPNPGLDPAMRSEAITCATCHVRLDASGRSLVIAPKISGDAPHPVREDKKGLRSVCIRCHSPGPVQLTPTFFCWFETAEELAAGPYAGKKDCVDCHMPAARHAWVGGGVPKRYTGYSGLLARGYEAGLEVEAARLTTSPDGKGSRLTIAYSNARAGHKLPTADPERFLLLGVDRLDASGKRWPLGRQRIGQSWDWGDSKSGRPAKRLADNRLAPKEARKWELKVQQPAQPAGQRLDIWAIHVRLKPDTARHMQTAQVARFEHLVPDAGQLVAKLDKHYPLFSWIHREQIDLPTGASTRVSAEALIEASAAAQKNALKILADLLAPITR